MLSLHRHVSSGRGLITPTLHADDTSLRPRFKASASQGLESKNWLSMSLDYVKGLLCGRNN